MTVQLSVAARNALLDALEVAIGTDPILEIRTGAQPANCATAASGTLLASMTLPSNWMANAASGAKALAGSWSDSSANASGTAAHFRIYASDGTTCHLQGSVTVTGGGGDLTLDSVSITAGQAVSISAFTLTAGNP